MKVEIVHQIMLPEIPSASGIEVVGDRIFIIGDDSPYLFVLNRDFRIIEKIKLFDAATNDAGKIRKTGKPDLEALTVVTGKEEIFLLALGSGSIRETRDVAYLIAPKDYSLAKVSVARFYDHLREVLVNLQAGSLNIEGATFHNNRLYLFQRGNISGKNMIISISWKDFLLFEEKGNTESCSFQQISLPKLKGLAAGFSGACIIPGTTNILFTASLENTSNAIDDGPSLGSYVGILDPSGNSGKISDIELLHYHDAPFFKKVESIAVIQQLDEHTLEALAVCDEDENPSWLMQLKITTTSLA